MDEQAQAVNTRRRRSRAEVEQLVAEYETSGLGRVEFCRKRGLRLSTLARYRKRRAEADISSENRWLAVEVSGGSAGRAGGDSGLAVALAGGRRIEIAREFDVRALRQLLKVVESV